MPRFFRIFLLLSWAIAAPTLAQVRDTAQVILPDLAPREVEIRGTLEISFPSLQRQPLIGFNPPPLVPQISPDRQPYVEPYRQAAAALSPVSLKRPDPPAIATIGRGNPANGLFESTLGRYLTRSFNGYLEYPLAGGLTPYAALIYTGSSGFQPFAERSDLEAPYDLLDARTGLAYTGRLQAGLELGGFAHRYRLYSLVRDLTYSAPRREGQGGYVQLRVAPSAQDDLEGFLQVRLSTIRYATTYPAGFFNQSLRPIERTLLERRLDLSGALSYPFATGTLSFDLQGHVAGIDPQAFLESDVRSLAVGATWQFAFGPTLQLTVGGRLLGLEATPTNTRAFYVSPVLELALFPASGTRLYVRQQPSLEAYRLDELLQETPVLDQPLIPQPALRSVDLEAGGEFFLGTLRLQTAAGFTQAPLERYRYQIRRSFPPVVSVTRLNYAEQRRLYLRTEATLTLPAGLQGTLGLTFQQVNLQETNQRVPYEPNWLAHLLLSYRFAQQRGFVQLLGRYEGVRYAAFNKQDRLSPYLDLDLQATYQLTTAIGVVARLENLAPRRYRTRWLYYPEPSAIFSAGMRIRW
ncbi:TonB-dependent receptor [Rhodothermus marinus]|uniref:TonB-dependent receptor n=1 Tax=Rhodothermus marinus TaxID=29549 RepID=UPI0012BA4784|nr:TonB-dependent receptor [Rhodothermus marinus]BBM69833.1 hypothetical protein RmaAA213_16790 [Rhodothermus marinus]